MSSRHRIWVAVLFARVLGATLLGDAGPERHPEANGFLPTPEPDDQLPPDAREPGQGRLGRQLAGPLVPSVQAPEGSLRGRVIFTSAGHGWTYAADSGRWFTQRPETNEMIEDYGNLDQMTLFTFYCFNAGATVVPLRPVGYQPAEVVLDNTDTDVQFEGVWHDSTATAGYGPAGGVAYRFAEANPTETATATFIPTLPVRGMYPVYGWARHGTNRTRQLYRIRHTGGVADVRIPHDRVGNGWVYLGSYQFEAGRDPARGAVTVSNLDDQAGAGSVVVADAIRFGNGLGSVRPAAGAPVSGYPREEEASRYWVQASLGAGQSTGIFDTAGDDASDNVGTPPRMAREMHLESAERPYQALYLGFHSNAGGGRGSVALYNDAALFPGTSTPRQVLWAQLLGTEVNGDLSALGVPPLEVAWYNRGANVTYARTDFAFGEIRGDALGGEMDASILEVAFHDDDADARLLRDPKVRNAVARAAYQAVVRYLNRLDGVPLEFLPEPPRAVRIRGVSTNSAVVSWNIPGVGGSPASGYRVYLAEDGRGFGGFRSVTGLSTTRLRLEELPADRPVQCRVTAVNAAGESLPSATVSWAAGSPDARERVLVVDGFDRFDRFLSVRQTTGAGVGGPAGGAATFDRVRPHQMNAFNYVTVYAQSLAPCRVGFDTCANESILDGTVGLADYAAVLWLLGEESSVDETFNAVEQAAVQAYLAGGGQLMVSGAEIAWDLDRDVGPLDSDRSFLNQWLHADLGGNAQDAAGTFAFVPEPESVFAGNDPGSFDDGTGDTYRVDYADVLTPVGAGSRGAARYLGGRGGFAAVEHRDPVTGSGLVYLGFPFETIREAAVRDQVLSDVLRYFRVLPPPRLEVLAAADPGRLRLRWTSVPSQRYQVQRARALETPAWEDLGPDRLAPGISSHLDVDRGDDTMFYRVLRVDETGSP